MLRRQGRARPGRRDAGFSLIEILVAVLIVSVGVLGVAGLQLISLRNNTSAMFRTQAFQAAYEIIDRIRANPLQDYSIALADAAPALPDCIGGPCTPAQLRNFDLRTWLDGLAGNVVLDNTPGGLPNGDGAVAMAAGVVTVTVQWQDDRAAVAPLSITVTTTL